MMQKEPQKTRYPINKEFFPYNHFTVAINERMIRMSQKVMGTPGFLYKDKNLFVNTKKIPAYKDGMIEINIITPKNKTERMPCLVLFHGGGFVFEGYSSHYRMAMYYAKYGKCMVIYVRYRLAPDYPFPVPQEDCYAAYEWVCDHVDELGIDNRKIAVAGDSAGGALAVTTTTLAEKRNAKIHPRFQLLVYPWLDSRNSSDSYKHFTDTPMWNSTLSKEVTRITDPEPEKVPLYLRSPIENESFREFPPAYIEVAEFDCLHDDGVLYAKLLREEGIPVKLIETKGTMHGFDTKLTAPTTRKMIKNRIKYIRKMFNT